MLKTINIKKGIGKDLLLVIIIVIISISLIVTIWKQYVEDIDRIEQRINQANIQSSNY